MIDYNLTISELEIELFSLGGTEAMMKAEKIIEGINSAYPIYLMTTKKIKQRENSMHNALKKLYEEYLK